LTGARTDGKKEKMLRLLVVRVLLTALLLVLVGQVVPGIRIDGARPAILGALVLGLVNAFVRPVLVLLTLPLTILTLGLFLFAINAGLLMLTARLVPGFFVASFGAALIGSLLLSFLHLLLASLR
jgi:putative membrane protein